MKKFLSVLLSFALGVFCFNPNFAFAKASSTIECDVITSMNSLDLSQEDIIFINKFKMILSYFSLEGNKLQLKLSDDDLLNDYKFNVLEIDKIHEIISQNHIYSSLEVSSIRNSNVYVSDWKIYFTNDDVKGLLMSAAQVGPAAIVAALTALGSMYPGVGTVIGAIVGIFGGAEICYIVLQAVARNQGLYIGIDWNGAFPNPVFGYF